jgi:N-acyl-D-amino-acid deacylase
VFDGTGAEAVRADVGILADRIAAVGNLAGAEAGRVLEADGLHVAPGFVDIHTHSDISVTYNPQMSSSIAMGVTTQVTSNCGLSMGLVTDADVFFFEKRWLTPHGARVTWSNYAEFLEQVEARGVANNFIPLAGHNSLRKRVLGLARRLPDAAELATMQRELDTAFACGLWGFTSGLEYPPGTAANEDELTALCEVAAQWGGFYATHLRNEGDTLIEAVQEAINVAERARLPLQISHHKAEGKKNWGKVRTTLPMIEAARARGLDVQIDQYPYTAFMTALAIQILPGHLLAGSTEEIAEELANPERRAALRAAVLEAHPEWDSPLPDFFWQNIHIGVCRARPEYQGRALAELATEAGQLPLDFAFDLLVEAHGFVSAVNFAIHEDDIALVMRHPLTSIGSDGVGTHPEGTTAHDRVHPRAYGTFPRVLARYVRELGILTEAEAIHKMTGLPAARIGLAERGLLQPGCFADITIYHPNEIADRSTFDHPHRFAAGIAYVLVNGGIVLEQGHPTGVRSGRVLRPH